MKQQSHNLKETVQTLKSVQIFEAFGDRDADLEKIASILTYKKVKKGEIVIVEGDPGTDMFLLLKGSVSVKLRLAGGDRSKRLVSFSPGVIFGEMALLDEGPRSADVVADEDSEMFQLSLSHFHILRREHPELATKLILNMAQWLSERLRVLSQEVRMMENA